MAAQGWTLLFHACIAQQMQRLQQAAAKAQAADKDPAQNANVKLLAALSRLMYTVIPDDPGLPGYRLGNTLGPGYRHWRRAKIGRRFRLFFRYDTRSRIIIYAWVNDANSLRSAGAKTDPYVIFQKMLESGNPADDWNVLLADSTPGKLLLHEPDCA
jgi:toxin YhaV